MSPEMSAPVVMYRTRFCGYCRMAERLLRQRGVEFEAHDVTGDARLRQWLFETTGQSTVPQIFVHGRPIGGYDELSELDHSGELDVALAEWGPGTR